MHCPAPCLFFSRDTVEHFPHQYWEHSLLSVSAVKWSIPGKHQIRKEPPAVSTVFYHKHGCSEQSPAYVLFCACPMPQNTFSEVGSCICNFFFFFAVPCGLWNLSSLTRVWTRAPRQWKHGVLTTGPPGNSPRICNFWWIGHIPLPNGNTSLHPHQPCSTVPVSPQPIQQSVVLNIRIFANSVDESVFQGCFLSMLPTFSIGFSLSFCYYF